MDDYKQPLFLSHWFKKEIPVADILWGRAAIWVMMEHQVEPVPFHSSSEAFRFIRGQLL